MFSSKPHHPSALDRYLWQKGLHLLGWVFNSRGGMLALAINAAVTFVVGSVFLTVAMATRDPEIFPVFSILGPALMTLGVGLGVGATVLSKRQRANQRSTIKLSSDGQKLVQKLMQHIGWTNNQSQSQNQWNFLGFFYQPKTASQALRPEPFQYLDIAAGSYLRLMATVGNDAVPSNPAIQRMAPSIVVAADETMTALFNLVAIFENTPESAPSMRKQIEQLLLTLSELVKRVESIASQAPTLTEEYSSPTAMRSVLEQLRMEEQARKELTSFSPESDEDIRRHLNAD